MAEDAKPAIVEIPPFKIPNNQTVFQLAEHAYGRFSVTLPVGVAFDEVLKPETWSQISHRFMRNPASGEPDRTGAVIEVRTQDHAFYAEIYVRAVRGTVLDVGVIREPVYFGPKDIKTNAYEVRWNVGKRGFDVIRTSDRTIVEGAEKFPTKELAYRWIEDVAGIKVAA